jgi:predicted dehydrogenase
MVRVGIVGTGWIGQRHLESLAQMDGVRVVGVCDIDRAKAEAQAGRWGLPVFDDYSHMLAEAQPEAVVICTPPTVRLELVQAAAELGIHCFIEKPPAKTLAAAREVQAVLDASGVINSVGFMYRYCKAVDRLRELIAGRRVALVHSRLLCALAMDPNWPRWFFDKQRSGGPIIDQAIHSLDLSRYILGEVAEVAGFGGNLTVPKGGDFTVEDSHTLALRYSSGVLQNHCHSWAYPDYVSTMEFLSDELHLHLDVVNSRVHGRVGGAKVSYEYAGDNAYRTELEAFVAAVRQGRPDLVRSTYADAVQTLQLTLAAYDAVDAPRVVQTGGDR